MFLRTLGELTLDQVAMRRPKPLLMLAYLALEGPRERRQLAELLWIGSARPLSGLSVALSQLRKVAPELFTSDDRRVQAHVETDAGKLLEALDKGEPQRALTLYRGHFLEGVPARSWGIELEEWVYRTREFLAGRAQDAMLQLAEQQAARGDFRQAAKQAEQAYHLVGVAEPEPETWQRCYRLLVAGSSPRAPEVRRELEGYGLPCDLTTAGARAHWEKRRGESTLHNLPAPTTALVGRDPELTELAGRLVDPECRLLTLTGIGGIGKTRLVLQAASDQSRQQNFAGGIFFVPLDSLTSSHLIPHAIADALGLKLCDQSDPAAELTSFITDKPLLLVLDNFEHLMTGVGLLPALLAACPRLKLLVTSRERLDLDQEWVLPLEGLAFPQADSWSMTDTPHCDAVQLFVRRAKRAQLRFEPDGEDLRQVLRICRLVEGSPLGIELAAVWIRMMPPADIAAEIERNLDFLSAAPRDAAERQRSIRATFEYSWRLLTTREQETLASLSVFRGGFTRQAAAEVAGASIPLLASLTGKSLLQVGERGRYGQHPLLHHYLQEKLAQRPAIEVEVQEAHRLYYLSLLQRHAAEMRRREDASPLDAIERDFENIQVAWSQAVTAGRTEDLRRAADWLRGFCDVRGKLREAEALFELAAASLPKTAPEDNEVLGHALIHAAYFALRLGHSDRAVQQAERGRVLLEGNGQPHGIVSALHILAEASHRAGDFIRAKTYVEKALKVAQEHADQDLMATSLKHLAILEKTLDNFPEALKHNLEALELSRRLARQGAVASLLSNLGSLYLSMDRPRAAQQTLQEGLEISRELGYEQLLPYLLSNLALVSLDLGDYGGAEAFCQEALPLVRQHGEPALEASLLSSLGRATMMRNDYAGAGGYLIESLAVAWKIQDMPVVLETLADLAELLIKQDRLAQATELVELLHKHPAALKGTRELVERLRGELRGEHLAEDPEPVSLERLVIALLRRDSPAGDPLLRSLEPEVEGQ